MFYMVHMESYWEVVRLYFDIHIDCKSTIPFIMLLTPVHAMGVAWLILIMGQLRFNGNNDNLRSTNSESPFLLGLSILKKSIDAEISCGWCLEISMGSHTMILRGVNEGVRTPN